MRELFLEDEDKGGKSGINPTCRFNTKVGDKDTIMCARSSSGRAGYDFGFSVRREISSVEISYAEISSAEISSVEISKFLHKMC